jgi:hypothetical protein
MIIFEFRAPDLFKLVSDLLEAHKIDCVLDPSLEPWSPSYIFLFEEGITTFTQRQALCRARELELEDRLRPEWPERQEAVMPLNLTTPLGQP